MLLTLLVIWLLINMLIVIWLTPPEFKKKR
jgi:hypothetical protein